MQRHDNDTQGRLAGRSHTWLVETMFTSLPGAVSTSLASVLATCSSGSGGSLQQLVVWAVLVMAIPVCTQSTCALHSS